MIKTALIRSKKYMLFVFLKILLAFFNVLRYLIENESGFHIGRYHERRCSKRVFGTFFLCTKQKYV